MEITKQDIEAVKKANDIVSIIKSKGIKLTPKGKNLVGLCPFHKEDTPSFTVDPKKQLYNCFGCSTKPTGGDLFGFLCKHDGISFTDVVMKLRPQEPQIEKPKGKEREKPIVSVSKRQKLLKKVIDYYTKTFKEDDRAFTYLAETRKITNKRIFTLFNIGYANGTLKDILPEDPDTIETLKTIGILNEKGNEHFYGSVIFPVMDEEGTITTIYARKIKDQPNNHMYLKGKRSGLLNWQTLKTDKELILTESIIDSLTLYNSGIKNTIPCYGTNGLTADHLKIFKKYGVTKIYICFDADQAGREALKAVTPKLTALNIPVSPVILPQDQDINSFFSLVENPLEQFQNLMANAKPALLSKETTKGKKYQKTAHGFSITFDTRHYEIIGISKNQTKLKATIKGTKTTNKKREIHVDTVDFYSSRSRTVLITGLSNLFGGGEQTIIGDINQLMELAEKYILPKEEQKETEEDAMTENDKKEALRFLKNPNLFDEILKDFETAGYTGDNTNKLLCYLACISRKLDNPISIMIQSRSAAGKSFLQDTVLSFIPEDDFIKYTRLTDQSLFYKEEDSLKHKILAIEEFDGMNGAAYSIRTMQSSKQITIAYTGKDPVTGAFQTSENKVNGPVMIFITTTSVDIDGETASRFMFTSLDESKEKTAEILKMQRQKHTLSGLLNKMDMEKIVKKHQAANRLLKPLQVINPYAELLTFSTNSIRVHREHEKYLNLISAIAFLCQHQREIKKVTHHGKEMEYITVQITDIEKAHQIANEVLGMSLNELSPPSKKLLLLIKEMVISKKKNQGDYHFTRRDIREYTGWSDFQVKTHIKELEELEYIYSVTGKKGKEYIYELIYTGGGEEGTNFLIGLISIEELKKRAKKSGLPVD